LGSAAIITATDLPVLLLTFAVASWEIWPEMRHLPAEYAVNPFFMSQWGLKPGKQIAHCGRLSDNSAPFLGPSFGYVSRWEQTTTHRM